MATTKRMSVGGNKETSLPNVVVPVTEEFSENVDGHDAKTRLGLDLENGEDRLVEDGVADVLGRFGVGGNLWYRKRDMEARAGGEEEQERSECQLRFVTSRRWAGELT